MRKRSNKDFHTYKRPSCQTLSSFLEIPRKIPLTSDDEFRSKSE